MTPQAMTALHALCFSVPRPWTAEAFAALLTSPLVFFCGTEQGFILGRVVAGEAELLTLAVHPDARRRGMGRQLLAEFHARAQARAATEAFLEVAADNLPAIGLYTAGGYVRAGLRRGYYSRAPRKPVDALILRKDLGPPAGQSF